MDNFYIFERNLVSEHGRRNREVTFFAPKAQVLVGLDGVKHAILKPVGPQLVRGPIACSNWSPQSQRRLLNVSG